MYKIVVYAFDESSFNINKILLEKLNITSDSVIWCKSSIETRSSLINKNLNTWLLFLDHDCRINQNILELVAQVILEKDFEKKPMLNMVYSGQYKNSNTSNYLQKTHNFIANTWLKQSYISARYSKLILGGVFLIFSTQKIIKEGELLFWGAEDKKLAYVLNEMNYLIVPLEGLEVLHETNATLKHFIKRAYLHGKNEIKYINKCQNKINYYFWIRKIGFANLNLLPLILLHFCIQRVALIVQKIRPKSR